LNINCGRAYIAELKREIYTNYDNIDSSLVPVSGSIPDIGSSDINWGSGYFLNRLYLNNIPLEDKSGVLFYNNKALESSAANLVNRLTPDGVTLESGEIYSVNLVTQISGAAPSTGFGEVVETHQDDYLISNNISNGGEVFLYERSGNIFTVTDLTVAGVTFGDDFGSSLGFYTDIIAIGSPGSSSNSGELIVYEKNGLAWTQSVVDLPIVSSGDRFADKVDIFGSTIVCSAPFKDNGVVYILQNTDARWEVIQELEGSNTTTGSDFGSSIAVQGDYLIISTADNQVYVFFRNALGQWAETQIISVTSTVTEIDIHNEYFVLSFLNEPALVYRLNQANIWILNQSLPINEASSDFGRDVAIRGDIICLSAPNTNTDSGVLVIYQLINEVWTNILNLENSTVDNFGYSVGLNDTSIIVGRSPSATSVEQVVWYDLQSLLQIKNQGVTLGKLSPSLQTSISNIKWVYSTPDTITYTGNIVGGDFKGDSLTSDIIDVGTDSDSYSYIYFSDRTAGIRYNSLNDRLEFSNDGSEWNSLSSSISGTVTISAGSVDAGGVDGAIQFNSASEFAGDNKFKWDAGTSTFIVDGNLDIGTSYVAQWRNELDVPSTTELASISADVIDINEARGDGLRVENSKSLNINVDNSTIEVSGASYTTEPSLTTLAQVLEDSDGWGLPSTFATAFNVSVSDGLLTVGSTSLEVMLSSIISTYPNKKLYVSTYRFIPDTIPTITLYNGIDAYQNFNFSEIGTIWIDDKYETIWEVDFSSSSYSRINNIDFIGQDSDYTLRFWKQNPVRGKYLKVKEDGIDTQHISKNFIDDIAGSGLVSESGSKQLRVSDEYLTSTAIANISAQVYQNVDNDFARLTEVSSISASLLIENVEDDGTNSVVIGEISNNTADVTNGIAGGSGAHAIHENTFIWSDGTPFSTSRPNTFNIFAENGVNISGGNITINGLALAVSGANQTVIVQGSPNPNEVTFWAGSNQIDSDSNFTWDGSDLTVSGKKFSEKLDTAVFAALSGDTTDLSPYIQTTTVANLTAGLQIDINNKLDTSVFAALSGDTTDLSPYIQTTTVANLTAGLQIDINNKLDTSVFAQLSGGGDVDTTLLQSISGNLQEQINIIETNVESLSSGAQFKIDSQDTSFGYFTDKIKQGSNITFTISPSSGEGAKELYINSTMEANGVYGSKEIPVDDDTVRITYPETLTSPGYPIVSLVVPVSGAFLQVTGIYNSDTDGFNVQLSNPVRTSGYKVNWTLNTSSQFNLGSIGQSLVPSQDITYDLGSPSKRWRDLYLDGSTLYIGSETISVVEGVSGTESQVSFSGNEMVVLDEDGSLPLTALPSEINSGLQFMDTMDPTTSFLPPITAFNIGSYFIASNAGTFTDNVSASFEVNEGDWAITNGTTWKRMPFKLPVRGITSAQIKLGAIRNENIFANAITTSKIANEAVTIGKLDPSVFDLTNFVTSETDVNKVLRPDGEGGFVFGTVNANTDALANRISTLETDMIAKVNSSILESISGNIQGQLNDKLNTSIYAALSGQGGSGDADITILSAISGGLQGQITYINSQIVAISANQGIGGGGGGTGATTNIGGGYFADPGGNRLVYTLPGSIVNISGSYADDRELMFFDSTGGAEADNIIITDGTYTWTLNTPNGVVWLRYEEESGSWIEMGNVDKHFVYNSSTQELSVRKDGVSLVADKLKGGNASFTVIKTVDDFTNPEPKVDQGESDWGNTIVFKNFFEEGTISEQSGWNYGAGVPEQELLTDGLTSVASAGTASNAYMVMDLSSAKDVDRMILWYGDNYGPATYSFQLYVGTTDDGSTFDTLIYDSGSLTTVAPSTPTELDVVFSSVSKRYFRFNVTNIGYGVYLYEMGLYGNESASTENTFYVSMYNGGAVSFNPSSVVFKDENDLVINGDEVYINYMTNGESISGSHIPQSEFKSLDPSGLANINELEFSIYLVGQQRLSKVSLSAAETYAELNNNGMVLNVNGVASNVLSIIYEASSFSDLQTNYPSSSFSGKLAIVNAGNATDGIYRSNGSSWVKFLDDSGDRTQLYNYGEGNTYLTVDELNRSVDASVTYSTDGITLESDTSATQATFFSWGAGGAKRWSNKPWYSSIIWDSTAKTLGKFQFKHSDVYWSATKVRLIGYTSRVSSMEDLINPDNYDILTPTLVEVADPLLWTWGINVDGVSVERLTRAGSGVGELTIYTDNTSSYVGYGFIVDAASGANGFHYGIKGYEVVDATTTQDSINAINDLNTRLVDVETTTNSISGGILELADVTFTNTISAGSPILSGEYLQIITPSGNRWLPLYI
jgi:hypothetical protein